MHLFIAFCVIKFQTVYTGFSHRFSG